MARSSCPEVALHEDEPAAMAMIFTALHYYDPSEVAQMSPGLLGNIAIHCDKYECLRALRPWA